LFICHGAHDVRVTLRESAQLVELLKAKDLDHEYLLFTDEGHGISRPENRMKFCTAVEKFLAKYLGGRYQD
jgi:dipeptidyl aminopeptidase/acylaminoacyl peptidase